MSYADDTKIHTSDPNPQVVEEDINRDLANTLHWFQQNGMKANYNCPYELHSERNRR